MFYRSETRIPAWAAISLMAAGVAVVAAMFIVSAEPARAADEEPYHQACVDGWDDAPASSYCTRSSISRVSTGSLTTPGNCIIEVSSCSITVNVGDTSTTFTPTWPGAYGSTGNGLSADDVEDIDICFASNGSGGHTATVKIGCASGETDAATAASSGLSA